MKLLVLTPIFLLFSYHTLYSQDPGRYAKDIKAIELKYSGKTLPRKLIIFTGSSSLRRWEDLENYFPSKNIINTAFGGSQMSDLLFYSDTVIIKYKPIQVFIYEGDNDLSEGEKPDEIIKEAELLFNRIHKELPRTEIVIISAKPSPVRWALKVQYLELNSLYKTMEKDRPYLKYIDLWTPLLGPSGQPRGELFISDSLHINNDGYRIWAKEIKKIMK